MCYTTMNEYFLLDGRSLPRSPSSRRRAVTFDGGWPTFYFVRDATTTTSIVFTHIDNAAAVEATWRRIVRAHWPSNTTLYYASIADSLSEMFARPRLNVFASTAAERREAHARGLEASVREFVFAAAAVARRECRQRLPPRRDIGTLLLLENNGEALAQLLFIYSPAELGLHSALAEDALHALNAWVSQQHRWRLADVETFVWLLREGARGDTRRMCVALLNAALIGRLLREHLDALATSTGDERLRLVVADAVESVEQAHSLYQQIAVIVPKPSGAQCAR